MDYDKELRVAIQAVTAAGRVTLSVFQTDVKPLDKPDKSPVTGMFVCCVESLFTYMSLTSR